MRLAPEDIEQVMPEDLKSLFLPEEVFDRRPVHFQNLRLDEGCLGAKIRTDGAHLLLQCQVGGDARILVGIHARIAVEAGVFLGEPRCQLQAIQQLLRRTVQGSFEPFDPSEFGEETFLLLFPRVIGGIDSGQVPQVLLFDFASVAFLGVGGRRRGE